MSEDIRLPQTSRDRDTSGTKPWYERKKRSIEIGNNGVNSYKDGYNLTTAPASKGNRMRQGTPMNDFEDFGGTLSGLKPNFFNMDSR